MNRLYKEECSIRAKDLHYNKPWGDSCGDCGDKWLQKVAKVATGGEFEGLKMEQGMHYLQILVFSRTWE